MIGLREKCRNHFCLLACVVDDLGFIIFVILVSFVPKKKTVLATETSVEHVALIQIVSLCGLYAVLKGHKQLEEKKRGKLSDYPCFQ